MEPLTVKTPRLTMCTNDLDGMQALLDGCTDPEMQDAYRDMMEVMRRCPGQQEWGCEWNIFLTETGAVIGCAHMSDGTPVLAEGLLYGHAPAPQQMRIPAPGSNTTIGVVAVDCKLTKEQANRLADVSHDGLARTIRPVHTQMDGDTMFALGTGRVDADVNFVKLCAAAAEVTARAIANALLFSRL